MIELLFTTLVLLSCFLFLLFFLDKFIMIKIIMIISQLILCIILLTNNFYKKHYLWNGIKYQYIHELSFNPVYEIYPINNSIGFFDHFNSKTLKDRTFSLIGTELYSKKCLNNYYINSELECPITQIYLEYEKSYKYYSFHELIINQPN